MNDPTRSAQRARHVGAGLVLAAIALALSLASQHALAQSERSAKKAERTGEQVVRAQCAKCHDKGVGGAPKVGDREAWVPRMKAGLDALVSSAIAGHGGMPARGGMASLTDAEIRNAVVYMFNKGAGPAK